MPGVVLKHFRPRRGIAPGCALGAHQGYCHHGHPVPAYPARVSPLHDQGYPGSVKAIQAQARLRLFRWAEAASSRPVSRAPVCNRASNTSCRRPDHPSSTATWNRPDVPTRRSSDNCTTATLPWALNRAVRHWETVYYTIRPHQSLDGRTLAKYLASCHPQLALPFHMYRTSASRFRSRRIPL